MPYRWSDENSPLVLRLEPHQSMTPDGFVWFMAPTAILFALPLFAVLGTPVLWILLTCFAAAVGAVWLAISTNQRAQLVREELQLWPDRAWLVHRPIRGVPLEWEANPYWINVRLRAEGGPVENYLTLTGAGREVEIGRFLAPEERMALKEEIECHLARLRGASQGRGETQT